MARTKRTIGTEPCAVCGKAHHSNMAYTSAWQTRKPTASNKTPYTTAAVYVCLGNCASKSRANDAKLEKEFQQWIKDDAARQASEKVQSQAQAYQDRVGELAKNVAGIARNAALPKDSEGRVATMLRIRQDVKPARTDVFKSYESLTDFLAVLDQPCKTPTAGSYQNPSSTIGSNKQRRDLLAKAPHDLGLKWEGMGQALTLEQLKAFWFGGWEEGLAKMRADLDRIEAPETQDIRRKGTWSDNGSELSLDRLYAGQYETAWRSTTKRRVYAPTRVRIVVDIGSSCGMCNQLAHDAEIVLPETLFWRGAAATALCETLDAAGFSVEIVVAAAGNAGSANYSDQVNEMGTQGAAVTVKGFQDPTELATVTSATASASLFRRAFLMWFLTVCPFQVGSCYHNLLRVETTKLVREQLGLDEEDVATVYVSDWVLSAPLANAWARAAHVGLESANDPDFESFEGLLDA